MRTFTIGRLIFHVKSGNMLKGNRWKAQHLEQLPLQDRNGVHVLELPAHKIKI